MPPLDPPARPLADLQTRLLVQRQQGRPLVGVFTDVDDTLTDELGLMPAARAALHALAEAGLPVVAITGRPVGWSERFLLGPDAWPVQAIVAENGAVALLPTGHGVEKRYQQSAADRAMHFQRLQAALAHIELNHPGAHRARDSAGRETDIAIDHSEHHHLDPPRVQAIVADLGALGLRATVSSIHINAWIGEHDKAQGAAWIVRELWGRDLGHERDRWVAVGDSTNDQVLFAALPHTVGVANIRRFWPALSHRPAYVTPSARGDGFAQLAEVLLAVR
jgi:HAD superfamily hydrolase (TIGR01484 family)